MGAAQNLQEWQYRTVPFLQTDSPSAFAVCKRRGRCRMKHIDLKMFTVQEKLKTGRLRVHKPSTHDNRADLMTKAMAREKLINLGRALNLRRSFFAATCTVTSVTPITETLTVLMNTVNRCHNHRLSVYRETWEQRLRYGSTTHHSLPLQTVLMNPPKADRRANG